MNEAGKSRGILHGTHVTLVFQGAELGGAERQGLLLADELHKRFAAEVSVVSLMTEQPGGVSRLCAGMNIPWRPCPFGWRDGLRERIRHLAGVAAALRTLRPQVILPYTWMPNVCCGLIWRFTGARQCVWNQRDEGMGLDGGAWQRAALSMTPVLVANSEASRVGLINCLPGAAGRIKVIPNAVHLDSPRSSRVLWRERLTLKDGQLVACMLANLHRYKDHRSLLYAWAELCKHTRNPPLLLLAGRGGYDGTEQTIENLCAELGLADSVRFLGPVDDVAGLLSAVDIYVHSAVTEGLPNAILEAMASGLPVVATDLPGIREAVGEAGVSCLVPGGDARVLAEKLAMFLGDAELRRTVGTALRERAVAEFSVDRMVGRMVAVMTGTAASRRCSP